MTAAIVIIVLLMALVFATLPIRDGRTREILVGVVSGVALIVALLFFFGAHTG